MRALTEEDLEPLRRELAELRQLVAGRSAGETLTTEQAAEIDDLRFKVETLTHERDYLARRLTRRTRPRAGWAAARIGALARADNACEVCGLDRSLSVHHRVPRSRGGTDEPDNLVVLCPNHHAEAHRDLRVRELP